MGVDKRGMILKFPDNRIRLHRCRENIESTDMDSCYMHFLHFFTTIIDLIVLSIIFTVGY